MVKLPSFVEQLHAVYAGIAKKIEELVFLLNEGQATDANTKALATKIEGFLSVLATSILTEKALAQLLSFPDKKAKMLRSIQAELGQIKELQSFIALSKKKPTPKIITKIHLLYREVEKEIKAQEAILSA